MTYWLSAVTPPRGVAAFFLVSQMGRPTESREMKSTQPSRWIAGLGHDRSIDRGSLSMRVVACDTSRNTPETQVENHSGPMPWRCLI